MFDVYLIEIDDEHELEDDDQITEQTIEHTEALALRSENEKLEKEIEQLKQKMESDKIIMCARINYANKKRSKEVQSLKMQVESLEKENADLTKKIFPEIDVIIFFSVFINIFCIDISIRFFLLFRINKTKSSNV